MREKRIESGMDTEAIKTLLKLSIPPRRQEGEGITIAELRETTGRGERKIKKMLFERKDLVAVQMITDKGRLTTVFIPMADAKEKYPDWIINLNETS